MLPLLLDNICRVFDRLPEKTHIVPSLRSARRLFRPPAAPLLSVRTRAPPLQYCNKMADSDIQQQRQRKNDTLIHFTGLLLKSSASTMRNHQGTYNNVAHTYRPLHACQKEGTPPPAPLSGPDPHPCPAYYCNSTLQKEMLESDMEQKRNEGRLHRRGVLIAQTKLSGMVRTA